MPKLVTCIKKCFYGSVLLAFILTITSLFVWQAEVYQATIEEQVSSMKAELSHMKKENHLLEIKLNEQFGKHDDLKDEFRYLVKQAKWSLGGEGNAKEDQAEPIIPLQVRAAKKPAPLAVIEVLSDQKESDVVEHMDFSKRETLAILSEQGGGALLLGSIFDQNEQVFYLPGITGLSESGISEIKHCNVPADVISYYKKHPDIAARSSSISQFCKDDACEALSFVSLREECVKKSIIVISGLTEGLSRSLLTSFELSVLYVVRDPRALVSSAISHGTITEQGAQQAAKELCARIGSFIEKQDNHYKYKYQIVQYEKLAASPRSVLAEVYHTFLDSIESSSLVLSKEMKNKLFTTISSWKSNLAEIVVDAVVEECREVIESIEKLT